MQPATILSAVLMISISLTGLGYGFKATLHEATYLFRQPGQLLGSLVAMNVVMLVLAIFLALFTHLDPLVKVVLVAISVSSLPPLFMHRPVNTIITLPYVNWLRRKKY